MIKLDKKDLRILDVLDQNPHLPVNDIAKKVGVSRQVAEYRLHKLISQKIIHSFFTFVDVATLGYTLFRVHFRLKNSTRETYQKFAANLYQDYPCLWIALMSGSFDLIFDVFAASPQELQDMLSEIVHKNKNIIQSYESLLVLSMNIYQYSYFLKPEPKRRKITFNQQKDIIVIDDKNRKILALLKNNCRLAYEVIGKKVGLTRNAVKSRIKSMEESGVIAGYGMFIAFSYLNKKSFKIFIKYNPQQREEEKNLLIYLKSTPGILATLQLFGKWDLDIEIHQDDIQRLQEFMVDLRNRFGIIEDYDIVPIIEEFGIDFFPQKLIKT